jgi:flagellar basal-body rod protein FlgG
MRRQESISHNLANLNTTGFREDVLVSTGFPGVLQAQTNGLNADTGPFTPSGVDVGAVGTGVDADRLVVNFQPGPNTQTGDPYDVAINGSGFFTVQTGAGEAYTRDGAFRINKYGILENSMGQALVGQNGSIRVGPGEFKIEADGTVKQNGNAIDKLKIVDVDRPEQLRKAGDTLFVSAEGETPPQIKADASVEQGVIERSNVDATRSFSDMMMVMRSYQSSQRVIKLQDEALERAVNDVGRLNG